MSTSQAYFKDNLELTGNVFEDMAAFDKKYEFDNVKMTPEFLAFRLRFLIEELREGIDALLENRPADFVDAMIDLIVVASGTLSIRTTPTTSDSSATSWDGISSSTSQSP
jgi:hypothetical protein